MFHDCEADLWGAIELETGEVRGDLDPENLHRRTREIFTDARASFEARTGQDLDDVCREMGRILREEFGELLIED
jgi:hypothetical protein